MYLEESINTCAWIPNPEPMDWQKPLAPLEHAVCILISPACIASSPQKFGRKADAIFALILYPRPLRHRKPQGKLLKEQNKSLWPVTNNFIQHTGNYPLEFDAPGYTRLSLFILLFLVQRHISVLAWPPGKSVWLWAKRTFWAPLAVGPQCPWLHLRFWLISFPISKPLFYGRPRCSTVPTSVLVCKKTKSIERVILSIESVCVFCRTSEKRNYSISEPLQHLRLVPLPPASSSSICSLQISTFFCWLGIPTELMWWAV